MAGKPSLGSKSVNKDEACWTGEEVQNLMAAARKDSHQMAAFYGLVFTTGLRLGELCGLRWSDIDFKTRVMRVARQLLRCGTEPKYGPTKGKRERTIRLDAETLKLLSEHKVQQAIVKMQNRDHYHDNGLVFAKEWDGIRTRSDVLGAPLDKNNWSVREHRTLCKAAGVRVLKFHATRHSAATMLLNDGHSVLAVSGRLGHSKPSMTSDIYGHQLDDAQARAAARAGELVHGKAPDAAKEGVS